MSEYIYCFLYSMLETVCTYCYYYLSMHTKDKNIAKTKTYLHASFLQVCLAFLLPSPWQQQPDPGRSLPEWLFLMWTHLQVMKCSCRLSVILSSFPCKLYMCWHLQRRSDPVLESACTDDTDSMLHTGDTRTVHVEVMWDNQLQKITCSHVYVHVCCVSAFMHTYCWRHI